jgi:hypothetical protein
MAACVRLAMTLLLAVGSRGADFVWWFGIAHRCRTATTLKVVSIDSEWQHYSTKVVSDLFFLYKKYIKLNRRATVVYAPSCLCAHQAIAIAIASI